jgi:hypothetical protein
MNKTHEQMFGCDPDAMMAELLAPIAENGLARVGELRKLHAETTPGVWHALPG